MAYSIPTVDDFTARFPIFADKDQTQIQFLIDEATRTVDITWEEQDYAPAILYLAAHLLATDNSAEGESVAFGGAGGAAAISSESFGGMSLSYDNSAKANDVTATSAYGSTEYGRRFYRLLINNKTGPVVV